MGLILLRPPPCSPPWPPPGMAEAFWEYRLKPWDMAAGVLVVEEAGGTVTTLDGRAFSGEPPPGNRGSPAGCSARLLCLPTV